MDGYRAVLFLESDHFVTWQWLAVLTAILGDGLHLFDVGCEEALRFVGLDVVQPIGLWFKLLI